MLDPLKTKTRILIYTAIVFAAGLAGASAMSWAPLTAMPTISQTPQLTDDQIRPALDLSEAFVNIAQAVTPAVVRIEAERPGEVMADGAIPEQFRQFFDTPPDGELPPQLSGGSGFIVSEDGYILTNNHVVAGATTLRVYLPDRREYSAEVIGTDPTTDIAVLKIADAGLPTLSLGSSNDLRVGEWVLAVGNPGLGGTPSQLDYTVTSGIVSALGRGLQLIQQELQMEGYEQPSVAIEDFIQTDAVINPGNSGGPMVNLRGQVVGVNSAIASRSGFYQGYGFAVPIDLAQRVMEDLIEFGEVRRAYLGIVMQPVEAVDAEYYRLPRPMGALIQDVVDGSPAGDAGLQQEDVVVELDGVTIERPSQLQLLIAQHRPGEEVSVRFYRNGEVRDATIRLGVAPLGQRPPEEPAPARTSSTRIGIDVMPLSEEAAQQFGYDAAGGVVVGGLTPAGAAARAGVGIGEQVLSVNREDVTTVADIERVLADIAPGDIVSLRLGRPDGSTRIVNLRVP
jgi:serine protease Do